MKLTAESTVINDNKLNTNIDNAQTTADGARVIADEAKTIADDTAQFFWFTSSGDDTGAHISEKTRAEFETAPSGGNLLARSNGIAVRDGLQELANFSESGIVVGDFFDVTNGGGELSQREYKSKTIEAVDALTINLSTDKNLKSKWASIASGETFYIRVYYLFTKGTESRTHFTTSTFTKGTSDTSQTYATYDGDHTVTVTTSRPTPSGWTYQYKKNIALGSTITMSTPFYRFGHDVAEEGGAYGFLTGHGTKAAGNYQLVGGEFNEETSDAYFIIGDGTSNTNRKNAFVVDKTGGIFCKGHTTEIGAYRTTRISSAKSVPANTSTDIVSITLPAGSWVIEAQLRFNTNAIGYRTIVLSPNSGDTSFATMDEYAGEQVNAVTGQQTAMNVSLVVSHTVETTYYLTASHSTSSAVDVNAARLRAIRIA